MTTNIPDPTIRNTTEQVTQLNPAGPEWKKERAFDMITNIPDPTIRNTTEQVTQLNRDKSVTTASGNKISLQVDTLCVHGDNLEGVHAIEAIRALVNGG